MKIIYLFSFVLLFSTSAYAQSSEVEKQVEKKRKELLSESIDTTVCYYRYVNGSSIKLVIPGDTICHPDEIKYLFGVKKGQSFVQRFDGCKQHQPMSVSSTFITTIKNNYKKLVAEKVLPPEYIYWERGEKISMTQSASHSTYTIFEITAGTGSIRKNIDHADLGIKYLDGKHKNINYLHNLNSIQYKLKALAEEIVKKTGRAAG